MKLRQIIVMVQSFGHFDRINFLKLFPEVNFRDISKKFNLGYRDETYVLSNGHKTCQNYYGQIIMNHMYVSTL